MFDNTKNHTVFAKNTLRVGSMSKGVGGVQTFLRDGWYEKNQQHQIQLMWYSELNSKGVEIHIQKGIRWVLEERNLWPSKGLKLECPKPKCNCYFEKTKCKECIKAKRYESCKEKKEHNNPKCTSQRRFDACVIRRDIYICTLRILYV